MFWVGFFVGLVAYAVLTIIMVVITKRKLKKDKAKKQEYDTLVDGEILKNKRG